MATVNGTGFAGNPTGTPGADLIRGGSSRDTMHLIQDTLRNRRVPHDERIRRFHLVSMGFITAAASAVLTTAWADGCECSSLVRRTPEGKAAAKSTLAIVRQTSPDTKIRIRMLSSFLCAGMVIPLMINAYGKFSLRPLSAFCHAKFV
jgi:hypothetical protein